MRPTAVVAVGAAAVSALSLSSCLPGGNDDPGSTPEPSPSASAPSPSASPSPSPSATPEPTPSASPEGPITGAPQGTPVTPDIFMAEVDGDVLRVVVFVPGIYEDGGTCTVTVKAGSASATQERPGEADVSSTACGQFTFSLQGLPEGSATVVASYSSAKHSGESEPTRVTLP